jgi:CHAD domain-containing protein
MARARRVKGIHPKESLTTNARRVIAVRLEELVGWGDSLQDATRIQDLHDMRIAAKRLRYALEMFDICFPDVKPVLRELTDLQESLGTIHDLDVFTQLLRERLTRLDSHIESSARDIMRPEVPMVEKSRVLRRMLSAQARDQHRVGLIGLLGDKAVQREREFERLQRRWRGVPLDEFRHRVELVTSLQPAPSGVRSDDGQTDSHSTDGRRRATKPTHGAAPEEETHLADGAQGEKN